MNRIVLHAVTLTIGLTLGVALDRAMIGGRGEESMARNAGGAAPPATLQIASGGTSATLDLSPFRAMIREELALAANQAPVAAAKAPDSGPSSAPVAAASPQEQQEASQAVQTIISSGSWDNQQREQFHQRIDALDPAAREQAMQQLVQAIDSGSLKVSTTGPML